MVVKKAPKHAPTKRGARRASRKASAPQVLAPPANSTRQFRRLVENYYEETFNRFPVAASAAGRHEFDSELGRGTPETYQKHEQLIEETMAAIEELPPQDFDATAMLDRRTMLASLRLEHLEMNTLKRWRNNPQAHLQMAAEAVYDLLVKHADDLTPVAEPIISRLKKIPRYLDESRECLLRPDPLWKELTLKMTPGVASMFEALVDPLSQAAGRRPQDLKRITARAAQAVRDYADHLKSCRPAPKGSYAIGEPRMAMLMRERLGLDFAPREAVAYARRLAAQLKEDLRKEARRFHARRSAHEILAAAAEEWKPEGDSLLEAYRAMTHSIRGRFEEAGLVGFPGGDRLLVKPVPEFMRDQFPTAAYSSPGALDPDQTGIFWVNDLSRGAMKSSQRRKEIAQHFGLELTCAHEAYPGHHLQFITQNRIPSMPRKMAHHAIYYEGWTLWCEQMTADLLAGRDGVNPYLRLIQLHDALWRAWRIVIDVGLQTGELTYDQACETLMREVGFTRARAQGDVNWYTAAPTVPMSYLIGKMELLRLKHKRVDMGDMSLREFNDWILSFGAIPWRWIEESGI